MSSICGIAIVTVTITVISVITIIIIVAHGSFAPFKVGIGFHKSLFMLPGQISVLAFLFLI